MPRKKSIKKAAKIFTDAAKEVHDFFDKTSGLKEDYHCWCTDYALIRLYREFETLMLDALAGAINNNASTISSTAGFDFPKHMSESVCRYLVIGTGYFDFKGRDGLIKTVKEFVPENHYLVTIVKDAKYKDALERLSALRNFSAHNSEKSKSAAINAIGGEKIGSAGSWLRKQDRFKNICESLKELAADIEAQAPY